MNKLSEPSQTERRGESQQGTAPGPNVQRTSELPDWRLPAGLVSHRDADDAESPCTD